MDVQEHEELERHLVPARAPPGMHDNEPLMNPSMSPPGGVDDRHIPYAAPSFVQKVAAVENGGSGAPSRWNAAPDLAPAADQTLKGPPPPPLGAEKAPRPHWAAPAYLCQVNGCGAVAEVRSSGNDAVPTVCSKIICDAPGGRAYWEVRIDRKGAGLIKVGLANFHECGPGDPGLSPGQNWHDRRGVGCTWYLNSDGELYEGNREQVRGSSGSIAGPGDVIACELVEGHVTFSVNYVKVGSSSIKVSAWPVTFAVLLMLKGDHVTLLREERQSQAEHQEWRRSFQERASWWASEYKVRRELEEQAAPSQNGCADPKLALEPIRAASMTTNGIQADGAEGWGVKAHRLSPVDPPTRAASSSGGAGMLKIPDLQMAMSSDDAEDEDEGFDEEDMFMDIPEEEFMDIPTTGLDAGESASNNHLFSPASAGNTSLEERSSLSPHPAPVYTHAQNLSPAVLGDAQLAVVENQSGAEAGVEDTAASRASAATLPSDPPRPRREQCVEMHTAPQEVVLHEVPTSGHNQSQDNAGPMTRERWAAMSAAEQLLYQKERWALMTETQQQEYLAQMPQDQRILFLQHMDHPSKGTGAQAVMHTGSRDDRAERAAQKRAQFMAEQAASTQQPATQETETRPETPSSGLTPNASLMTPEVRNAAQNKNLQKWRATLVDSHSESCCGLNY